MTSFSNLKRKMASTGNFLKAELDISTKLSNLEERASKLELEFSGIMSAARELANLVKRCADKAETESRSWDLLESVMESSNKVRDILDHVKIFFNFVLAKMAARHADITDIKMLWHLVDNEGVKQVFNDVIKSFGFKADETDDIKLLLAVTYKLHVDMEREIEISKHTDASDSKSKGLCKKRICEETICKGNESPGVKEENPDLFQNIDGSSKNINMPTSQDISGDDTTMMDYPSISIDVNDEVSSAVLSWNVEDSVKNVARRMIAIVNYTLNIGRKDKNLCIISK